jgi:hypothetical protein
MNIIKVKKRIRFFIFFYDYLNFARVGGFHRQEEPLTVIRSDASSRKAGALKGEVVVYYYEALITQHMGTSGSPSG